ncbi:hypothetical protein MRX96_035006 [Rhipicephalus microplus]
MSLLEFETQMFLDLHNEDGLVIVAKGLGIERLLLSLIKVHNDPGSLVLILGTTAEEEEFFISQLPSRQCFVCRTDVYLTGGALFVTSRILVVDMLMERVPINLITGIIVYRAHKTLESCQEAFILRLYRQKNKTGFVKGLSDSAVAFYPRLLAKKRKPEVVEIRVAMTPAMNIIQMAILDIIASCVREIKKCNPSIEMEDITVENTIARRSVWFPDIKTLRTLLLYLTQHDCVTFYSLVKSIHDSATAMTQVSDWLFLDAADTLYVQAKARVYGVDKRSHKDDQKQKNPDKKVDPSFQPEHSPKWAALSEILAEIKEENKEKADLNTVLIVAEDDRTCGQLSEYLCSGADTVLCNLYRKAVGDKDGLQLPPLGRSDDNSGESPGKRRKKAKSASDGQKKKGNQDSEMEGSDMTETETEGMESPPAFPNTIFHPLKSSEFALQQLLYSVEPKYIILYDVNIATVREIEMYQATRAKEVLRVYFLMYEDSIDEQRYLTSLRREKDAFEFLIKEKSIMVIPEEQDGKGEYHPDLIDDLGKSNEPASSRKAGGAVAPVSTSRRVIVDLREFRSELPSLIHRRGINVQPVTIEVGDYILTPEICVERKSLNDLIGSLNNGRLYNQAQAMCRYYKRPVLLIEFNQNQPFCLQGKHVPSSESTSSQTFVSKLILLTMHFPRLRLLWCQSPYATAEIFDILKHGKEEPSVAEAQAVTEKELQDSGKSSDKYNPAPQDFLLHLPGVSLKNYTSLMRKFTCLADMFKASEEELSLVMGNAAQAKALWQAIHNPIEHNPQKAVPQRKFRKK